MGSQRPIKAQLRPYGVRTARERLGEGPRLQHSLNIRGAIARFDYQKLCHTRSSEVVTF